MKVCGKRDVLVPECSDCSELEERVDAVEKCCDDAHEEIDTLNTDKADKGYVDDSIENVNQTIVDVADTLGERIDNIITASEPSVITLWEGVMDSIGDSANLSEDVNDFDYLDIYYRTSVDESEGYYNTVRIPADQFANYTITVGGTLSPLGESPNLSQYLTQVSFVDDTATIDNIREWSWDGSQSSDAADDPQAAVGVTIYRIDGVKEAGGSLEIADAREGVDGTIYPSLGDAIRDQIQDTRDMIQPCPVQDVRVNGTSVVDAEGIARITMPELVKTVQGNPIVIDDAWGEVKNLTVELLPVQEGSGTPSPQNIRPITGHDSVNVTDTGKNLFDNSITLSVINVFSVQGSPTTASGRFLHLPAGTYTWSYNQTTTSYVYGNVINADGTWASTFRLTTPSPQTCTVTLTAGQYMSIYLASGSVDSIVGAKIQLEHGSTATTYEPYKSQSKTVTLPHTVYGAGVGVTSGEGKEKRGMLDLGTLYWVYQSSAQVFRCTGSVVKNNNILCDSYATASAYKEWENVQNGEIQAGPTDIIIKNTAYTDATAFKNSLNGVMLCYELQTPTDLTTTPTDITLYNGDNVISSDGDMELSYVQDMAIVIRKIENQL